MDILSFIIGYLLGVTTIIWIAGIIISSEKVQEKVKQIQGKPYHAIGGNIKPAQIIKRDDPIEELLKTETK